MTGASPAGVTVNLPTPLRARAGKRASVRAGGATVRAIINDLDRQFPGMGAQLCEETGKLRPFVNIFLDNDNVRDLQGLDTAVSEGATIHVLLSVAGGSGRG